jgi:hypothetical protein
MGDDEDVCDQVVWNGVDATTGTYAFDASSIPRIAKLLEGRVSPGTEYADRLDQQRAVRRGVPARVDPELLEQAGWGLVVPAGREDAVIDLLAPLVARRQQQAGARFKILTYAPGDTMEDLRERWIFSPGVVNPRKVPAYLLIVGDPEEVPFSIEHDLNADLAVGRIAFDLRDDARRYAEAVVASEQRPQRSRTAAFFATRHPDDRVTERSIDELAAPLSVAAQGNRLGLEVSRWFEGDATRARLKALCGGPDTPAFLFAACHGLVFPSDDPQQRACQGALVTQEWRGPRSRGPIGEEARLCAADIGDGDLGGMVAMLFSCFGAGTPAMGEYPHQPPAGARRLARQPFVARLPQALLARGAGAVIGHVERTWDVGFRWTGVAEPQLDALQSVVEGVLDNWRVGHALFDLRQRYTSASAVLAAKLKAEQDLGRMIPPRERAFLWMVTTDARGWTVLGDPAVRLSGRVPT